MSTFGYIYIQDKEKSNSITFDTSFIQITYILSSYIRSMGLRWTVLWSWNEGPLGE